MEELNENQRAAIGCACDCLTRGEDGCACRCHKTYPDATGQLWRVDPQGTHAWVSQEPGGYSGGDFVPYEKDATYTHGDATAGFVMRFYSRVGEPECAKCMIATQDRQDAAIVADRIAAHVRDGHRSLVVFELVEFARTSKQPALRPDILADLTAEELRYLQHSALTSHWQTERAIEIAERFEQLAKGRGK